MSSQTTPAQPIDKVSCKLCRRQFSKYTCPTCNVPYCSLTCFRSESHSQCSETFYKKEVESDIQSDTKSPQERLKMLELLRKFEEENGGIEDPEAEEDNGDDLARRFRNVDLNSASTEDLWSKLTPEEQNQFMKALEDPKSELAQQLLASEEVENDRCDPWWEVLVAVGGGTDSQTNSHGRRGSQPDIIRVPSILIKPWPNGPPLTYNMCAICIAYSYITRHLAMSPLSSLRHSAADIQEAQKLVSQLVPFLVERKSTMLYPNLSQLIPELWSRFKPGEMDSLFFSVLLRDTAGLIRPLPVTIIPQNTTYSTEIDSTSHPHLNSILVLSDVSRLFELSHKSTSSAKPNHVTHKLTFYAAHILSTPSSILWALAEELLRMALTYGHTLNHVPVSHTAKKQAKAVFIEEI